MVKRGICLFVMGSALFGCGDSPRPRPDTARTWAAHPPPSVAAVKSCLRRRGLVVYGKPDRQPRPRWDASDHGELYAGGASLYFYSSHPRAARLGPLLEDHVRAVNEHDPDEHLTIVSRGTVRVIYPPSIDRAPIEACLRDAPPWEGR
jgi:hypothetical protein